MSLARSKASHDAAIATSLSKLGAARRERLSEEDYEVYVEGLREFSLAAVQTVCADLAKTTPEEFGPRFPTLGAIRAAIVDHLRRERETREANTRRLTEARQPPLSPEKRQELRDQFNALVGRKVMP